MAATTGWWRGGALGSAASGGPAHAAASRLGPRGRERGPGPAGKRGIILYTVRDAISRDPNTTDAALRVLEVFQERRIGYKQVEFAGFNQHANAPAGT